MQFSEFGHTHTLAKSSAQSRSQTYLLPPKMSLCLLVFVFWGNGKNS